ncbi:radical SAM protein [Enhygromyxa salina]|uniref:radical SAM protein n=1 Tax=Enhygromyxa salina TaxID=215803 RepID=UPI0011BA750F|nr:radical SAM protein [Enhygromyxa salina]
MQIVLKLASRCNLNCSYCYVYNKGDRSWEGRPKLMSDGVFSAALCEVKRHAERTGDTRVHLSFHGGEPTLVGSERFEQLCARARHELRDMDLSLSIQTNGVLLDRTWMSVFETWAVGVGVSLDGPPAINDRYRIDHVGRGTHAKVARALDLLSRHAVEYGVICVIPLGEDPLSVHRHFLGLGVPSITYLLPDFTHDTIGEIRPDPQEHPCADFLIPIFDDWWFNGTLEVKVRDLYNIARVILGGNSLIECIGNPVPNSFFIHTDGAIEGLDALAVCGASFTSSVHNIHRSSFAEVLRDGLLPGLDGTRQPQLGQECSECPEATTCAGGYLPHRHSRAHGFTGRSVWCADLLLLFTHIRSRLGVSPQETLYLRRQLDRARSSLRTPR